MWLLSQRDVSTYGSQPMGNQWTLESVGTRVNIFAATVTKSRYQPSDIKKNTIYRMCYNVVIHDYSHTDFVFCIDFGAIRRCLSQAADTVARVVPMLLYRCLCRRCCSTPPCSTSCPWGASSDCPASRSQVNYSNLCQSLSCQLSAKLSPAFAVMNQLFSEGVTYSSMCLFIFSYWFLYYFLFNCTGFFRKTATVLF